MPSVVIVGGGLSGLSLAYRVQQAAPHVEITLLENQLRPGGLGPIHGNQGFLEVRKEFSPGVPQGLRSVRVAQRTSGQAELPPEKG